MKKTLAIVAAAGLVAPAMADDNNNEDIVTVNIEVAEEVAMEVYDNTIDILLNGKNDENSDVFVSTIGYINNVNAKIDVLVDGTLPDPTVNGGGINFFIFEDVDEADAYQRIVDNAYTPQGALVWTKGSLNTSQELTTLVPVPQWSEFGVTFAAAAPGELPAPGSFALTATFTISIQ